MKIVHFSVHPTRVLFFAIVTQPTNTKSIVRYFLQNQTKKKPWFTPRLSTRL